MLALDPPDGGATVGGVVASGDSGPLRARYGGVRDLVVGMRVALSDGTLAKSGGKVIKNVAGYDLAKLFAGSFGTLGAIVEVSVRLHPLPPDDRHRARARRATPAARPRPRPPLAHAPLEHHGPRRALGRRARGGAGALRRRRARPAGRGGRARCWPRRGSTAEIVEDDDAALGRPARRPARAPRSW